MDLYVDDLKEGKLSGIFPFEVDRFFQETPEHYLFCSSNNNLVAYDTDGQQYCCHMLTPLVVGGEKAKWVKQNCNANTKIVTDDRCKGCPIYSECRQCPAMNIKMHGEIGRSASASTFCKMKKIQARASATLFLRHLQVLQRRGVVLDDLTRKQGMNAIRLLKIVPSAQFLHG